MFWGLLIFCILLLAFITILSWYAYTMTKRMLFISENFDWLNLIIEEYRVHLEIVYNMETFHGEPIIQNLIVHTRDVEKQIKKFEETYSLEETYLQEENDFDEEKEE